MISDPDIYMWAECPSGCYWEKNCELQLERQDRKDRAQEEAGEAAHRHKEDLRGAMDWSAGGNGLKHLSKTVIFSLVISLLDSTYWPRTALGVKVSILKENMWESHKLNKYMDKPCRVHGTTENKNKKAR